MLFLIHNNLFSFLELICVVVMLCKWKKKCKVCIKGGDLKVIQHVSSQDLSGRYSTLCGGNSTGFT